MSRTLSLRWLILLPCSVLLLVPVLGCLWLMSWLADLEENEIRQLENSAVTIATLLSEKQVVVDRLSGLFPSFKDINAITVDDVIVLDGRDGDWPVHEPISFTVDQLLEINAAYSPESFSYRLRIAANQKYLYLFYEVTDDVVVYREINNPSVHRNDHIRIGVVAPDGSFQRYVIANFQPTETTAHNISGGGRSLRQVTDIRGQWRATESGYNVELQFPRRLIGERFATVVADVDDRDKRRVQFVMGSTSVRNESDLGWITFPDNDIQKLIERLPFARVMLTDSTGKLIAETSSSASHKTEAENSVALTALSRLSSRFRQRTLIATVPISHLGTEVGTVRIEKRNDELLKLVEQAMGKLLIGSGLLFTVAVLLALLSARLAGLRLLNLNSRMQSIVNPQGRIGGELPMSGSNDEIGELTRGLNNLFKRIGQYNDYLERMAGRLSHELRTPVSVVRSSLENMNKDDLSDEQAVYLERAHTGIRRLTNILNKISEARRLEESLDEDEVDSFNLAEVVKGCVQGYEAAFPDYKFTTSIEADPIPVTGIPELMAQLLDKLVNNAVEFSSPGDVIKVRLTSDKKQTVLRVINSGVELPPGTQDLLFDSMVSIRDGENHRQGNHLGLGLYIAKVITDFHGGTIHAANREDARGVIVTVVIPLMRITSKLR